MHEFRYCGPNSYLRIEGYSPYVSVPTIGIPLNFHLYVSI